MCRQRLLGLSALGDEVVDRDEPVRRRRHRQPVVATEPDREVVDAHVVETPSCGQDRDKVGIGDIDRPREHHTHPRRSRAAARKSSRRVSSVGGSRSVRPCPMIVWMNNSIVGGVVKAAAMSQ